MVLEFDTNLSDGTTIALPLYETVNVTVDWGDGTNDSYITAGTREHTYASEGTYLVSISGTLVQFGNGDTETPNIEKLVKVISFGNIGLTSLNGAFYKAANLTQLPLHLTSTVRSLSNMLRYASTFNFDISSWDTSNVTDMSYLFFYATEFNQDIGSWNVSNVTNMSHMFYATRAFNQNIGGWDVSNVTNMSNMFRGVHGFNQDIGGWNMSKVTNTSYMFCDTYAFNQNIGSWDVSKVTTMERMFLCSVSGKSTFNQDIGNWKVSEVTNMQSMFFRAHKFNQDISSWDVSKVADMNLMFFSSRAFNQDVGSWDVRSVTNMTSMFADATLSSDNYSSLLIGWAEQTVKNGVVFDGGNSKYSLGDAAAARTVLTEIYDWTITDGGESNITAVNFAVAKNIDVYPNPFRNEIRISNANDASRVVIATISGEVVLNQAASQVIETDLPSGIYLITIIANNGKRVVKKMIKE